MKIDWRKRWKWFVLIGVVALAAAVALWLSPGGPTVNTTLRLSPARPEILKDGWDGKTNQPPVWVSRFLLHSDRMLETVSTNYSMEAHTPAGSTNYNLPFRDDAQWQGMNPFQIPGCGFSGGDFVVFMPIDADAFRVKIEIKEFGDAYSRFENWANNGSGRKLNLKPINRLAHGERPRGVVRTIWSPWVVRSNDVWMEKVER